MTQIFAVKVNRDDTVRVVAADVVKETPGYYFIEPQRDWNHEDYGAFYSRRVERAVAHTSARAALTRYMERRQRDKANALGVAGQVTKQIASANELLMHLPEALPDAEAVGQSS